MVSRITADIVEKIEARCQIYSAAFQADVVRLSREHGHQPVQEALAVVSKQGRGKRDPWNRAAHARAVKAGIERVAAERRARTQALPPDDEWR